MKRFREALFVLFIALVLIGCGQVSKNTGTNLVNIDKNIVVTFVDPYWMLPEDERDFFDTDPTYHTVEIGGTKDIIVSANETDGLTLNYLWQGDGSFESTTNATTVWHAPSIQGIYYPELVISNGFYSKKVKMAIRVVDLNDKTAPAKPNNVTVTRNGDFIDIAWDKVVDSDVCFYEITIEAPDDTGTYKVTAKQNFYSAYINNLFNGDSGVPGFQGEVVTVSVKAYDYAGNSTDNISVIYNLTGDQVYVYCIIYPFVVTRNQCFVTSYFKNRSYDGAIYVTPDVVELYVDDALYDTLDQPILSNDRYYFNVTANTSAYDANKPYEMRFVGKKNGKVIYDRPYVAVINTDMPQESGFYISMSHSVGLVETAGYSISAKDPKPYEYKIDFEGDVYNGASTVVCSSSILTTPAGVTYNLGAGSYFYYQTKLPNADFTDGEYRIEAYQGETIVASRSFEVDLLGDERIYNVSLSKDTITRGETVNISWNKSGDALGYASVNLFYLGHGMEIELYRYYIPSSQTSITVPTELTVYPGRYRVQVVAADSLELFYGFTENHFNQNRSFIKYTSDQILTIE